MGSFIHVQCSVMVSFSDSPQLLANGTLPTVVITKPADDTPTDQSADSATVTDAKASSASPKSLSQTPSEESQGSADVTVPPEAASGQDHVDSAVEEPETDSKPSGAGEQEAGDTAAGDEGEEEAHPPAETAGTTETEEMDTTAVEEDPEDMEVEEAESQQDEEEEVTVDQADEAAQSVDKDSEGLPDDSEPQEDGTGEGELVPSSDPLERQEEVSLALAAGTMEEVMSSIPKDNKMFSDEEDAGAEKKPEPTKEGTEEVIVSSFGVLLRK